MFYAFDLKNSKSCWLLYVSQMDNDFLNQTEATNGVVVNMPDHNIVVSEFEHPSHCYVHFRTWEIY